MFSHTIHSLDPMPKARYICGTTQGHYAIVLVVFVI
jgi:hypothetical protein